MSGGYSNVAWFYDNLSRVVFGRALVRSQVYLLQYIPANSNILIVGGGTGWILEEITYRHPRGLKITYVEVSDKMMILSERRNVGENQVTYINDAVENITGLADFDIIITPFLFDNFNTDTLKKVFNHIHPLLKTNGLWLNTDFQLTGKWWQSLLLNSMLLFFKLLCNVESNRLPNLEREFEQYCYKVIDNKTFFGQFIVSKAFLKQ